MRWLLPNLLVIVVGIALSLVAAGWQWQQERARSIIDFNNAADDLIEFTEKNIEDGIDVLGALTAFYASSQKVSRDEFGIFARAQLAKNASIQALEWIPVVTAKDRAAAVAAARRDGFADFRITERDADRKLMNAKHRTVHLPVYFVEPFKGNEVALGFDLASNDSRREAASRSRDLGKSIATSRITLVQAAESGFGFLVFSPIYDGNPPPSTVPNRKKRHIGFVLAVYKLGSLIRGTASSSLFGDLELTVLDNTAPPGKRYLFSTIEAPAGSGEPVALGNTAGGGQRNR